MLTSKGPDELPPPPHPVSIITRPIRKAEWARAVVVFILTLSAFVYTFTCLNYSLYVLSVAAPDYSYRHTVTLKRPK